jgi:hypothetical protein
MVMAVVARAIPAALRATPARPTASRLTGVTTRMATCVVGDWPSGSTSWHARTNEAAYQRLAAA